MHSAIPKFDDAGTFVGSSYVYATARDFGKFGELYRNDGVAIAGDAFYVTTNERDARFFDLYRYDAKTYARTLAFKNEAGWEVADISRDGRWLALVAAEPQP